MRAEPFITVSERLPLWIGVVLGIGIAGSLDEIVLHQVLQWHNFYTDASERWRIISDGLFHLFSYSARHAWSLVLLSSGYIALRSHEQDAQSYCSAGYWLVRVDSTCSMGRSNTSCFACTRFGRVSRTSGCTMSRSSASRLSWR